MVNPIQMMMMMIPIMILDPIKVYSYNIIMQVSKASFIFFTS